jgi:hypothetical protein
MTTVKEHYDDHLGYFYPWMAQVILLRTKINLFRFLKNNGNISAEYF